MKLFGWLRRTNAVTTTAPTALRCAKCGGGIHRHDRYRILAVVHRDCGDPKQVGQKMIET
jgi:hypothetical protein